MKVLSLTLQNFRNIENIEIFPDSGMNVICGENAQGKTNLLESIWLFTGAKSFRGCKDDEFIRFGEKKSECEMKFISEGIEKEAQIKIEDRKSFYLNGKRQKSSAEFAGNLNAIVFSPTDLKIVSESAKVRRKFLDGAICQLYPAYIEILRNYNRAVIQRNKILKDSRFEPSLSQMLDIFEKEIAANGKKIIKYRKRYIEILSEFVPNLYEGLSEGREKLEISYVEHDPPEELEKRLFEKRKEDLFCQKTSVGPHRDDIFFLINGINTRTFGSQGQKRSVALALKLGEAQVIEKNVGECPICLLDDVMSELDPNRQNFILNHIKGMQTFLTCCDPQNVKNLIAGKKFILKNGGIV